MLKLVRASRESVKLSQDLQSYGADAVTHHNQLLDAYMQSHRIRNHSMRTIEETERYLKSWFVSHGSEHRSLYTWEALAPVYGRNRIASYAVALKDAELTNHTIRKYLGMLRGYFSYVLEHPYIFGADKASSRISELYGPIEQPVSEYDIPAHTYDDEQQGVPFEPSRLYELYNCLRANYINPDCLRYLHHRARNYAMLLLAGETGLRSEELAHLEIKHDLFFDSKQIQTRFAKAANGSGKKSRLTVFPPLARASVQYYLKNHRQHLQGAQGPYLFCATNGGPIDYNSLQRAIVEMRACANKNGFPILPHYAWHWQRRLFATRFIERFPDKLPVLIQLLGHVTGQTVHKYIRHSKGWMETQTKGVLIEMDLKNDQMEI